MTKNQLWGQISSLGPLGTWDGVTDQDDLGPWLQKSKRSGAVTLSDGRSARLVNDGTRSPVTWSVKV
jgi:hypothetical protein